MNWDKKLCGDAVLALLSLILLSACSTFEMKFERIPVPTESGRKGATPLLSPVSTAWTSPTPTPEPAPQPTATTMISITSFTVSPLRVRAGDPVTLTWSTIGAKSATLERFDFNGKIDSIPVSVSGSLRYDMATASDYSYRFLLLADDGYGFSDVQAWVQPEVICPIDWFFSDPPARCPTEPQYMPMIAQRFQHGLMIWAQSQGMSDSGTIYLIYNDHGIPSWSMEPATWSSGMPESDPDLIPPPGFYQPVRSLGLTWRESLSTASQRVREQLGRAHEPEASKRVRDRLGWALEPALALENAAFQCEEGPNSMCFISGPQDQIYALLPEDMPWWLVWTLPGMTPIP